MDEKLSVPPTAGEKTHSLSHKKEKIYITGLNEFSGDSKEKRKNVSRRPKCRLKCSLNSQEKQGQTQECSEYHGTQDGLTRLTAYSGFKTNSCVLQIMSRFHRSLCLTLKERLKSPTPSEMASTAPKQTTKNHPVNDD